MKYLNSAARERIYKLQALHTFCEGMRDIVDDDTQELFDHIIEASEGILSIWQDGISAEAKEGLRRYAAHHQLSIEPRGIKHDNGYIIKREDIKELMSDLDFGCRICVNSEEEVKRCKRRKLLERMGLEGTGASTGNCPFESGIEDI